MRQVWILRSAVVVVGLLLAWYVSAVTLSLVFGLRNPAIASTLGHETSDSLASKAQQIISEGNATHNLERAEALARASLAHEPGNVLALRSLGLVALARSDTDSARAAFDLAERMSRRDLATQIWLIEDAAKRGDIAETLEHYDRALRTSERASRLLYPVLNRAALDPVVRTHLRTLLGKRPPWWSTFYEQFLTQSKSASSLSAVASSIGLNPHIAGERDLLAATIARLEQLNAYSQAYAFYRAATPGAPIQPDTIRNGSFEAEGSLPPFDWSVFDRRGLAAAREGRPENRANTALALLSDGFGTEEVARQTLLLKPGAYRFGAVVGSIPSGNAIRPTISVTCAPGPLAVSTRVFALQLPAAPTAGIQVRGSFDVPRNCPAQLLTITLQSSGSAAPDDAPWIDDISIQPASASH